MPAFPPETLEGRAATACRGGTGSWLVVAIVETTQSRSSKFATCGSGGPFRWGLGPATDSGYLSGGFAGLDGFHVCGYRLGEWRRQWAAGL